MHHYLDYATIIKKNPFLISLRRSLCKLHLTTLLTKKSPNDILPQKDICNLKTFFFRNFSGVLHDLLPVLWPARIPWISDHIMKICLLKILPVMPFYRELTIMNISCYSVPVKFWVLFRWSSRTNWSIASLFAWFFELPLLFLLQFTY